ncbi:LAMI_0G02322g1_1 [Lachancea mirantina]|uniref:LAMI_0G02322g1_1 n=1 Tax=Lachancea mirantina TaxID=1230905 RepID=A0A1G4K7S7_9SACH|nr:LAMI_0G02322g1_1 [Lachancea mirantina]
MSSPSFQPLHQNSNVNTNGLHRSMFKKPQAAELKSKSKFASPTDELLSPCSQKLNDHKSKLFSSKANPTKLNFASQRDDDDDED